METGFWGFVVIGGPILLGLALIFAILNNRRRGPSDRARTEKATRDLYSRIDAEDKAGGS